MQNQTYIYDTFPSSVYIKRQTKTVKNVAYYHLYLTDDPTIWTSIFLEQFNYLESSGLMANLEFINVRLITQEDIRIKTLVDLIREYPVEFDLDYSSNVFRNDYNMLYQFNTSNLNDTNSETITLKRLYDDAQRMHDDINILYFHSKGITSYLSNMTPELIKTHRKNHYWRNTLNWGLMTKWDRCVRALENYDTAGLNLLTDPYNHYSGNFWWTKASHVKRLLDPSGQEWKDKWNTMCETHGMYRRVRDEMWICSDENTKMFDLLDIDTPLHESCIPTYQLEKRLRTV